MSGLVNLSLDDIIAKTKQNKGGRGGLKRTGGGGGSRQAGSGGPRPRQNFSSGARGGVNGKWTHDRFEESENGGGSVVGRPRIAPNPNKTVRVNLSNLAPTVSTADLEELFAAYAIESAAVHFDEAGQSLGTGDVYLKRKDATALTNEFKGVALDGYQMAMVVVDGVAGGASITSRLEFRSPRQTGGGISKRPHQSGGGRFGGNGGKRSGPSNYSQHDDRTERSGGNGGGRAGGRGGGNKGRGKMTEAELDAELDAYMSKDAKMEA